MPFTPFIGLSIFIHITLIIVFKVFRLTPSNERVARRSYKLNNWVSLLIITTIFSFTFTTAAILVRASIIERHSSINFIKNHSIMLDNIFHTQVDVANAVYKSIPADNLASNVLTRNIYIVSLKSTTTTNKNF
jgi:hypothetical protein